MAYKHKDSNYKLLVRIRSLGTESDMNSVINNNNNITYMKPHGTLVLSKTLFGLHATLVSTRTCFFQTMLLFFQSPPGRSFPGFGDVTGGLPPWRHSVAAVGPPTITITKPCVRQTYPAGMLLFWQRCYFF